MMILNLTISKHHGNTGTEKSLSKSKKSKSPDDSSKSTSHDAISESSKIDGITMEHFQWKRLLKLN